MRTIIVLMLALGLTLNLSAQAPYITSITPNTGHQGQSGHTITIDVSGTPFIQNQPAGWSVTLAMGNVTITGYNINTVMDNRMTVMVDLPISAPEGGYDMKVYNNADTMFTARGFYMYAATGINDVDVPTANIYPQPTKGLLNIDVVESHIT